MDAPVSKKICPMCRMEIPQQARKCPYCHHFQNRWILIMYHPVFAVCVAVLPMVAVMIVFTSIFDPGRDYESYKGQIQITSSRIAFGDTKSGATVAVIGTITNASGVSWKDIYFHVDFFNAAGRRADVGEQEEYEYSLPASEASSFKVSFRREFPETNYVKATVRVVGAKDAKVMF